MVAAQKPAAGRGEEPAVPQPTKKTSKASAKASAKASVKATEKATDKITPMMAQYLTIKQEYADCLLFYRMGDFYELFFDDAVKAASALDITLTKRGKHKGDEIPMCGVPFHAAEGYLARLIRHGYKVAVCEQTEDPAEAKKRGSKAVVAREVIRVVTPGTLTEDSLLDARQHNFLTALAKSEGRFALAWLDMSTGDFWVSPIEIAAIEAELARLQPGELLVATTLKEHDDIAAALEGWETVLSPLPAEYFDSQKAGDVLKRVYDVTVLDGLGGMSRAGLAACGALLTYLDETQKGNLPRLSIPHMQSVDASMTIDSATRRNLELTTTLNGKKEGSLLATIDRTATGAGARLLAMRLAAPLTDTVEIRHRLDLVSFVIDRDQLRDELQGRLKRCPDIERALSRLSLGRGGPKDLAAIRDGLDQGQKIKRSLVSVQDQVIDFPDEMAAIMAGLGIHDDLLEPLERALKDQLPLLSRDGNFIAEGYHAGLDELRVLRDESRRLIAALEGEYREKTGISALKVRHNNVLGYYVEVTATHADRMMSAPLNEEFIHRQTLANAVRFNTTALAELAARISQAADRALSLELDIFTDLVSQVIARWDQIMQAAAALAKLDVGISSAALAIECGLCRPQVDDSLAFDITGGRHPVVEAALRAENENPFVANDCGLGTGQRLWLITGPNMAGKSTFLRQNALIVVMAQMGAYVPAQSAHIGVVDRLFSRVGASDDLARGRSTFMVEMIETAAILNQATAHSLVVLDEIGRGTATYDGLSIAWAAVEHLHDNNRCRGLFATHYHELTTLAGKLDDLSLHSMKVREWQGDVVFLHEVGAGAADRSYGIQVAKLAGLPKVVIERAQQVLHSLEQSGQGAARGQNMEAIANDLPLFSSFQADQADHDILTPLHEAMEALNPDELTPRAALERLYELKALYKDHIK
tara:strand:- start:51 stop:2846 length:2796 start_codon:yes stop_codon:yes gene_type:complete